MHNRYTLTVHSEYLHVLLQPRFRFTPASAPALHHDVAGTMQRQGLTRVLIEGDSPECQLGPVEVFNLGKHVADQLHHVAIAYCLRDYVPGVVHDDYGRPIDKIEFFGNVVQNRGGVIGFFESVCEARQWLRLQQDYPLAS